MIAKRMDMNNQPPLLQRLYVRIWLAVVLAVGVLTFAVAWVWQQTSEPPLREVVVRNQAGEIVGHGNTRGPRFSPFGMIPHAEKHLDFSKPQHESHPEESHAAAGSGLQFPKIENKPGDGLRAAARGSEVFGPGPGPQFRVNMDDGQVFYMHLPRPDSMPRWLRPFGFLWTLVMVGLAVALATYPIVRRLTRRLETLQGGVQRWGAGDLAARVPLKGDDEVGLLAHRFNEAASRVESLVNAHKSLLANASHELRSPLTRIRMGLELMGDRPAPSFKTEISRNIGELDQLIDEILLASRLDATEADIGTVEAIDLVGLAAEECARTDAILHTDGHDVVVPGIAKLLRRVIRNLLENARRYGKLAEGDTSVDIHSTVRHGKNWAILSVSDHGAGVPQHQRERIFEPFYRLPGASEREGGVGLGLALVKSIAQRHGGNVYCRDRVDGAPGACFVIELPKA